MIRRTFVTTDDDLVLVTVDVETGAVVVATRAWPTDPWSDPLTEIANEDDEPGASRRYSPI